MFQNTVIIGWGNQAKSWAFNLRDSGVELKIALRPNSPSRKLVEDFGLDCLNLDQLEDNSTFILLIPDLEQEACLEQYFSHLTQGRLIYAHGYSVWAHQLEKKFPQFSHLLLAPKAIATELRKAYQAKKPCAGVYALEHSLDSSNSKNLQLLAQKLGITQFYPCTFKQETEADLFSEQSLLCSLLPYAALESYNLLRKNDYPKELAFFECWHEVKLIADTMIELGPREFFKKISPNALIGGEKARALFFDENYRAKLNGLLLDIKSGHFQNELAETDPEKIYKKNDHFWKEQELEQTHKVLKENLYPESLS